MRNLCAALAMALAVVVWAAPRPADVRADAKDVGGILAERIQDLDLTDAQEAKIAAIREEYRPKVQEEAKQLEGEREKLLAESQVHETRHHHLTIGATLLEIGIAISTIAIITRQRITWIASGVLGIAGAIVAVGSYLV